MLMVIVMMITLKMVLHYYDDITGVDKDSNSAVLLQLIMIIMTCTCVICDFRWRWRKPDMGVHAWF